jgi:hypothetical protein
MPHELMHPHEGGVLVSTKPANQLVPNIGESNNCLKVIPDMFVEFCLCMVCIGGALLSDDVGPFGQATL